MAGSCNPFGRRARSPELSRVGWVRHTVCHWGRLPPNRLATDDGRLEVLYALEHDRSLRMMPMVAQQGSGSRAC